MKTSGTNKHKIAPLVCAINVMYKLISANHLVTNPILGILFNPSLLYDDFEMLLYKNKLQSTCPTVCVSGFWAGWENA